MDAYVQAGFGELLGAKTLADIKRLSFDGVRLEASKPGLVEEVRSAGLKAIALIKRVSWMVNVPAGTLVEFAPGEPPEPDLTMSATSYAAMIRAALDVADRRSCPLWVGAISNLHRSGLKYLRAILEELELRSERRPFGISVHWYPHGGKPETPHPGFESREAEVAELKRIIKGRPWGVTEFGYHTARRPSTRWWRPAWLGFSERWTDVEVAKHLRWEWKFWAHQDASFATVYQINDGDADTREGRFGLRDAQGVWKHGASALLMARSDHE